MEAQDLAQAAAHSQLQLERSLPGKIVKGVGNQSLPAAAKGVGSPNAANQRMTEAAKKGLEGVSQNVPLQPSVAENRARQELPTQPEQGLQLPNWLVETENAITTYSAITTREGKYTGLDNDIKHLQTLQPLWEKQASGQQLTAEEARILTEETEQGNTLSTLTDKTNEKATLEAQHTQDEPKLGENGQLNVGALQKEVNVFKLTETEFLKEQQALQQELLTGEVEVTVDGKKYKMSIRDALTSEGLEPQHWLLKQAALQQLEAKFKQLEARRQSKVLLRGRTAQIGGKWLGVEDKAGKRASDMAKAEEDQQWTERSEGAKLDLRTEDKIVTSDTIKAKCDDVEKEIREQISKALGDPNYQLTDVMREKIRKNLGVTVTRDAQGQVVGWEATENSPLRNLMLWEEFYGKAAEQFGNNLGELVKDRGEKYAEGTYWLGALMVEGDAVVTAIGGKVLQEGLAGCIDVMRDEAAKTHNWELVNKMDAWLKGDGKEFSGAHTFGEKAWDTVRKNWHEITNLLKDKKTLKNIGKILLLLLGIGLALVVVGAGVMVSAVSSAGGGR